MSHELENFVILDFSYHVAMLLAIYQNIENFHDIYYFITSQSLKFDCEQAVNNFIHLR